MRILFVKQELGTSITKEKNHKARNQKEASGPHSDSEVLTKLLAHALPCIRDRIKCSCLETPRPPMKGLLAVFILTTNLHSLPTGLSCQGKDGNVRRLWASPGLAFPLRNTLFSNPRMASAWVVVESSSLWLLGSHSCLYALLIPIPVRCGNTSEKSPCPSPEVLAPGYQKSDNPLLNPSSQTISFFSEIT